MLFYASVRAKRKIASENVTHRAVSLVGLGTPYFQIIPFLVYFLNLKDIYIVSCMAHDFGVLRVKILTIFIVIGKN